MQSLELIALGGGRARPSAVAAVLRSVRGRGGDRFLSAGPVGLLPLARQAGYAPADRYAGKCHLCWDIRCHLLAAGLHADELGPAELYDAAPTVAIDGPGRQ